jgi:hypothetical protein
MIIVRGGPPREPVQLIVDEVPDPAERERNLWRHEQFMRNMTWLGNHWDDLLPQALGKFVAVANEHAFVADTSAEARALAEAAYPAQKDVVVVQYVRPEKGPRVYAYIWNLDPLQ